MADESFLAYIIRSFRGGVSDEDSRGITGSFKHGYALDIHKKKDSLTCQQQMTLESSGDVLTDLPRFILKCPVDGSIYAFGDGGTIYARASDKSWTARYNDSNGAIKGAASWTFSDGTTYLVWATDTSVSRKQMWTSNSGMDWGNVAQNWKVTLTSADWHTMNLGCGNLLICNDQHLAMITYATTAPIFTNEAMSLRPYDIIKCLEERDDFSIMGSTRKDDAEKGYLWSWISTATNYIQKKKISAAGVNALIYTELPFLQAGEKGEIFFSDFETVVPVHKIPGGGFVNPGAVCEDENLAVFGVSGTSTACSYPGLWTFGRRVKNRPFALNYEYRMTPTVVGSTVTEIGAVANINGDIIASWKTIEGGNGERHYGIDRVDSTTKATSVYEGLEFDGKMPHLKKLFRDVKVAMTPLPSGTSIVLKYKPDYATSWTTAKTAGGDSSYSVADSTEAVFIINEEAKVVEIGVTLNPSSNDTPEITSITAYIEKNSQEY